MHITQFPRSILAVILLLAVAVGCSSRPAADSPNPSAAGSGSATAAASAEPRVVRHLKGETTIEGEPSKIAVLDYRLADSMLALGAKPYAMTTYLGSTDTEYLEGKPLEGVKNLGDKTNLEAVLDAAPDLIIARKGDEAIYDQLNKIAPTILLEETGDWRKDLRSFADILGKSEQASQWLQQYEGKATEAKNKLAAASAAGKTVAILRVLEKEYRVYGTSPQLGGIVYGDLGLQAPDSVKAIKKFQAISMESLPEFDADFLFVQVGFPAVGGDKEAEKKFDELKQSSLWRNLKAVKNDQAFVLPYWTLRDFPLINEKALELVTRKMTGK
ncbi:ABC transporter substrate-binding protein [Paenibacillus puerhi]|uniref:ABC transporter substrate-binding protein n=1 Tax=Paenibacillus puerhi TaxID=2692622 RepID=UPI00135CB5A8|nr:ABC transporter substrate-binding protein [Paenibacillus puerhi]